MSYAEYREWEAFYSVHPFGDLRGDERTALVTSLLYNLHRHGGKPKTVSDCMYRGIPKPKPSGDELKKRLLSIWGKQ
jgi:hypothetical protein